MRDPEDMIGSILPDVVFDKIQTGDRDVFLEALGADGIYAREGGIDTFITCLRDYIAHKNSSHVGDLVIDYVTSYYSRIAREEIEEDLEDYIGRYVNNDG
tara:strand:+ start:513 stop:812 length:300 start_codon:yes stop_codon:yes gene_type:complete